MPWPSLYAVRHNTNAGGQGGDNTWAAAANFAEDRMVRSSDTIRRAMSCKHGPAVRLQLSNCDDSVSGGPSQCVCSATMRVRTCVRTGSA